MGRAGSAIDTSDLTKVYEKHLTAVDRLNLSVRRGEVYGFLGPNGAGKTTTLRMLLGLVRATSGTARVLGEAPGDPENLARVGAMVEEPASYPYLSGRDNLRVIARYVGRPDNGIDAALDAVGLLERGGDRFNAYSQGMRQRLGVAAALLKDPELLILDEPTNGLDPAGMADMRTLIRTLGSGDRTVLLQPPSGRGPAGLRPGGRDLARGLDRGRPGRRAPGPGIDPRSRRAAGRRPGARRAAPGSGPCRGA
jgi:ABC-type multidrug transport system ATPase subunit